MKHKTRTTSYRIATLLCLILMSVIRRRNWKYKILGFAFGGKIERMPPDAKMKGLDSSNADSCWKGSAALQTYRSINLDH